MNLTRRGFLSLFAPGMAGLFLHHRDGHNKGRKKRRRSMYQATYGPTY